MSSPLLDKATLDALTAKITNGGKSTIFATSVARLYVAIDRQWKYTNICGVIAYVVDRESKVQNIRIYDLQKLTIRFQVEIPVEPGYSMDAEYFHTLELDNDQVIGFLFATSREQNLSDDKNKTLTSEAKRFGQKINQLSLKEADMKEIRETKQILPQDLTAKRRASSFIGKMRTAVKVALGGAAAPAAVGTPTDFRHVAHIGLNPDGTMDASNVPDEWKAFLKSAGVSKKDFKNPEMNKVIVSTLGALVPTSASKGSPGGKTIQKYVVVRFDHASSSEKEVSVSAGETVLLMRSYPDKWTKVKKADGQVGMVPSDYLDEENGTVAELPPVPVNPAMAAVQKSDSLKLSPMVAAPKKASPVTPAVPPPPTRVPSAAPPPRPTPPRPAATSGRAAPPLPASPLKKATAAPVQEEVDDTPEEPEAEVEVESESPQRSSVPRTNNALLAGIQGFNKEGLAKASEAEEGDAAAPPMNPFLASIKQFNKDSLAKAEAPAAGARTSAPNPLEAIKAGSFQLKKVERPEKPPEAPKAAAATTPEIEGIAGLLKAKLANIRLGVKEEEEDDDDAGSDWD